MERMMEMASLALFVPPSVYNTPHATRLPQFRYPTSNFSEPCVAVAFAMSRPGEPLADFRHRLSGRDHYTRSHGVELVLDKEAATELVRLLLPAVRRTEIGLLIETP